MAGEDLVSITLSKEQWRQVYGVLGMGIGELTEQNWAKNFPDVDKLHDQIGREAGLVEEKNEVVGFGF